MFLLPESRRREWIKVKNIIILIRLTKCLSYAFVLWVRLVEIQIIQHLKVALNYDKVTLKSKSRKTGGAEKACTLFGVGLLCGFSDSSVSRYYESYHLKENLKDPSNRLLPCNHPFCSNFYILIKLLTLIMSIIAQKLVKKKTLTIPEEIIVQFHLQKVPFL